MPLASLDDLCVSNGWSVSRGKRQLTSGEASSAVLVVTVPSVERETYEVEFVTVTATERDDLIAFFEGVGYTRSFLWTPPHQDDAEKFVFGAFTPNIPSGPTASFTATLVRKHGAR